jgi:bifunctional polynucleotide phosphatase/kinase
MPKQTAKAEMDDQIIQLEASRRHRLAIFDFDWTLVKPKEGRKFPKDVADWQWLRPSVPETILKFAKDHRIVIVTDQSKPWKVDQIKDVASSLPINTIVIGVKTQKPSTELFKKAFPKFHAEKAFYVGDAAGGEGVWSDKDRKFAEGLGITFKTPEEVFPLPKVEAPKGLESKKKEVVIMVGYPASGKSTIAKGLKGYYRVDGDALKTAAAMKRDAEEHVGEQSIVFDSTAGTKEKRAEFVKFAQKHELPVRVFWVKTPIDVAMERNKQRAAEGGTKVPDVVFYVYRKKFEEPVTSEGFTEILKL